MELILYYVGSLSIIVLFFRYLVGIIVRIYFKPNRGLVSTFKELPLVSFTIPCYNEGEHIYHTILSILEQDYPKNLIEVIVVDDCSTDNSYEWIKKAEALGNVKSYQNKINSGKRVSLIAATKMSKGEICVSVDSDVILDKNALKYLLSEFTDIKVGGVGGRVSVGNANYNWITQTQEIKYFYGYELFKSMENRFNSVLCLSGCLTAYRKTALIDIEDSLLNRNFIGIPIKYGEDRFLTHQLVLHGWKTKVSLKARCWTKSPTTLAGLFSQQLRWRRSNLIDLLYTLSRPLVHVKTVNSIVLLNYLSLMMYIIIYPIIVLHTVILGWGPEVLFLHLLGMVILSGIYQYFSVYKYKEKGVTNLLAYIGLGFILPVSYLIITPLALLTLDSGSWETRKK